MIEDQDDDRSFVQRHVGLIFLGIILLVAPAIFFVARKLSHAPRAAARQEEVIIRLPPPPPQQRATPRPTPTPEQTPPPEQQEPKMVEQQPLQTDKPQPPKEKPPEALGTSIVGPGGVDMGLSRGLGGGAGYGGGGGSGGGKYDSYARGVQNRIADAVRTNRLTRSARMSVVVRIWPDSTGRIFKARVAGAAGDATLTALQNDVLIGLQLTDPPPADMPLPIVMRLSAQRPQ